MNDNGMGTGIEYALLATALSIVSVVLATFYAIGAIRAYRVFHDDRAAVGLIKGIGLLVISVGLWISATGLIVELPVFSVAGMSVARGALIVLMATLVLAGVRPGLHHQTDLEPNQERQDDGGRTSKETD